MLITKELVTIDLKCNNEMQILGEKFKNVENYKCCLGN